MTDKPAILIHPNRSARGGRFDCHRVSLHSLLNYQADEQKELNFEVALFAEQFHTMMQRDCAFTIFKAVYSAPEKDGKYEAIYCTATLLVLLLLLLLVLLVVVRALSQWVRERVR